MPDDQDQLRAIFGGHAAAQQAAQAVADVQRLPYLSNTIIHQSTG
jgi:hypothetical protein